MAFFPSELIGAFLPRTLMKWLQFVSKLVFNLVDLAGDETGHQTHLRQRRSTVPSPASSCNTDPNAPHETLCPRVNPDKAFWTHQTHLTFWKFKLLWRYFLLPKSGWNNAANVRGVFTSARYLTIEDSSDPQTQDESCHIQNSADVWRFIGLFWRGISLFFSLALKKHLESGQRLDWHGDGCLWVQTPTKLQ